MSAEDPFPVDEADANSTQLSGSPTEEDNVGDGTQLPSFSAEDDTIPADSQHYLGLGELTANEEEEPSQVNQEEEPANFAATDELNEVLRGTSKIEEMGANTFRLGDTLPSGISPFSPRRVKSEVDPMARLIQARLFPNSVSVGCTQASPAMDSPCTKRQADPEVLARLQKARPPKSAGPLNSEVYTFKPNIYEASRKMDKLDSNEPRWVSFKTRWDERNARLQQKKAEVQNEREYHYSFAPKINEKSEKLMKKKKTRDAGGGNASEGEAKEQDQQELEATVKEAPVNRPDGQHVMGTKRRSPRPQKTQELQPPERPGHPGLTAYSTHNSGLPRVDMRDPMFEELHRVLHSIVL